MSFWIPDPQTKQPSVTVTAFVLGFLTCLIKLIASGLAIGSVKIAIFSGVDFAAAITALGGVYGLNKHVDNLAKGANQNDS
jgi:hypothetical protein